MEVEAGEGQIQIHLKTKQTHYAVPDIPYAIQSDVKTEDLNTFLNALLQQSALLEADQQIEFDFIVLEEYLQGRLCDHLREKGISFEDTIDIEYVERFPTPEPQDCLLHDDWVSAVKVCEKWVLTGCYDNTLNIWTIKGKHVLTIPGHVMPVKAVAWISLDEERGRFVSCAQDQTAMLWEWSIGKNTAECISICKGHERAVDCVDVSESKKLFATGSWDTMLKIWPTDMTENDDVPSKPKKAIPSTIVPKMTLQGHRECISSVQWIDEQSLLTASWDHSMKIWDLNMEGIRSEITANKSVFDANYSKLNRLILTASADKNLRLYDSRTNQASILRNTYLGHTQWVQSVMWSSTEEYLFISGSYDNETKLWDHRSPKAPLYDLIGHGDKVLDIDWSNPNYIASGGADNTVRLYKSGKAVPAIA